MEYAPIVLFTYNRIESVKILLNALRNNFLAKQSILYIYADGAKDGASAAEIKKIEEVRHYLKSEQWCKEVHIIESEKNMGCGPSIIRGVTEVVNRHGKVIVLEDDLNLSPFFLDFINDALSVYEDKKTVSSVGGCNFFACGENFPSTFFIQYPDCYGWGTWSDRWAHFEPDAAKLHAQLKAKNLIKKFNGYGAFEMESLLKAQISNHVSAWDVQWTAVCTLNNWLSLYPNPSVTQHLFLGDATHTTFDVLPPLATEKIEVKEMPVVVLPYVYKAMKLGYRGKSDFYGNKIKFKKDKTFYINKLRSYYHQLKKRIGWN